MFSYLHLSGQSGQSACIIISASHDFSFSGKYVGPVCGARDEDGLVDALRELVL